MSETERLYGLNSEFIEKIERYPGMSEQITKRSEKLDAFQCIRFQDHRF